MKYGAVPKYHMQAYCFNYSIVWDTILGSSVLCMLEIIKVERNRFYGTGKNDAYSM